MAIEQETINDAFALVVKVSEKVADDFQKEINRLEQENNQGSVQWKLAQELKIKINKIRAECQRNRKEYPHLFK